MLVGSLVTTIYDLTLIRRLKAKFDSSIAELRAASFERDAELRRIAEIHGVALQTLRDDEEMKS